MKQLIWTVFALGAFASCAALVLTACGDDSTGPGSSLCSRIDMGPSNNFDIDFKGDCSSFSSTLSNIEYNQYGNRVSFDFDIRCTTSSERYTGRLWNIEREEHWTVVSWEAEINGERCSFP